MDRLNLLCCDAASGLDTVHCSATKQASALTPRLLHALSGIGIVPYVATFLVNIFHLPRSYSYLANLEKSSPIHTWSSGRLRWRELEDTCTNADGWHEWRWFKISDLVFSFPTRSIAHHEINMQNKQYFLALKPANLKEAPCMAFEVICELADL